MPDEDETQFEPPPDSDDLEFVLTGDNDLQRPDPDQADRPIDVDTGHDEPDGQ